MRAAKHFYLIGILFSVISTVFEFGGLATVTSKIAFPIMGALFVVGGGIIDAISALRASNVVNYVVVNDLHQDRR